MPARVPMTERQRGALLALPATEAEVVRHHSLGPDALIGGQSGTPPGHAKILKSGVKSGKGGRDRRRAEPQSICDSYFVPISCGRDGRGPALDADPQYGLP